MKILSRLHVALAAVACIGFMVPQSAWSAEGNAPKLIDVKLQPGKVLQGQILNGQGAPKVNADVAVLHDGKILARLKTNQEGYFAVSNLNSGLYLVACDDGLGHFRVWSSSVAPPNAQQGALVVADGSVVRGNIWDVLSNPLLLGGVVVGGIITAIVFAAS